MAGTLEIVKSEIGRLLGLDGHNDPAETNGEYAPFLTGFNLRGFRIYPINKFANDGSDYKVSHPVFYSEFWDDFLGHSIDLTKWTELKGSDGSTAYPTVVATQPCGAINLTTGAGSTHTMAVNGSQIVGGRNYLISNGATRYEAAVGVISANTSQAYNMGLTDAITLQMPFALSGTTLTANATNAVAFVWDAAGTGVDATLIAAAVNAGGATQKVVCAQQYLDQAAPAAAALAMSDATLYHKYRIDVDPLGNAKFYVDDCLVASIALAVATTAVLAPTVATYSEATSGSQTVQIDYILTEQLRLVA
jgi:hypothetical protein